MSIEFREPTETALITNLDIAKYPHLLKMTLEEAEVEIRDLRQRVVDERERVKKESAKRIERLRAEVVGMPLDRYDIVRSMVFVVTYVFDTAGYLDRDVMEPWVLRKKIALLQNADSEQRVPTAVEVDVSGDGGTNYYTEM